MTPPPAPVDPPVAPVVPADFTCSVDSDVLSWDDFGANSYAIRRVDGNTEVFVASVPAGTSSFDLAINADAYVIRAFLGGGTFQDSPACQGNPVGGGGPVAPVDPGNPVTPADFVCTVTNDVITWTDIGANMYAIRRVVDGVDTFLASVPAGTTSFDLPENNEGYVLRAFFGEGELRLDTSCSGNPIDAGDVVALADFACTVSNDVLSWGNVGANSYAIRRSLPAGGEVFFEGLAAGVTSFDLPINADSYTVRAFLGGGDFVDASCAGNPA